MDAAPPPVAVAEEGDPVAMLKGERAALVVFSPSPEDPFWIAQAAAERADRTGLVERGVTIFVVFADGKVWKDGLPFPASAALFARLRERKEGYETVVVGPDGAVALRSDLPLTGAQIFAALPALGPPQRLPPGPSAPPPASASGAASPFPVKKGAAAPPPKE